MILQLRWQTFANFAQLFSDPPSIQTFPQDQTVVKGSTAVLVCSAVGNPNPEIVWRKNGKGLPTQRYTTIEIPNGSVLRIEPVWIVRDAGTYECIAENGIGEPVRAMADLIVLPSTSIAFW